MQCLCEDKVIDFLSYSKNCLGSLWIFDGLSQENLEIILDQAFRRVYEPGEIIFLQGDTGDKTFLIKAGKVKLSKVTEQGNEIVLDICKEGDIIGEQTLIDNFIYPVNAVCIEKSLICGFDKNSFEKIILSYPTVGLQVIKNLGKRIEWLSGRIEDMGLQNVEDRLYNLLTKIAEKYGNRENDKIVLKIALTHEELGFLLGVHRVTVSRAIKKLKRSGKIFLKDGNIVLNLM